MQALIQYEQIKVNEIVRNENQEIGLCFSFSFTWSLALYEETQIYLMHTYYFSYTTDGKRQKV